MIIDVADYRHLTGQVLQDPAWSAAPLVEITSPVMLAHLAGAWSQVIAAHTGAGQLHLFLCGDPSARWAEAGAALIDTADRGTSGALWRAAEEAIARLEPAGLVQLLEALARGATTALAIAGDIDLLGIEAREHSQAAGGAETGWTIAAAWIVTSLITAPYASGTEAAITTRIERLLDDGHAADLWRLWTSMAAAKTGLDGALDDFPGLPHEPTPEQAALPGRAISARRAGRQHLVDQLSENFLACDRSSRTVLLVSLATLLAEATRMTVPAPTPLGYDVPGL